MSSRTLKNHYAVLGVPQTADAEAIRKAFRALAKQYHPDKAPGNPFAGAHFAEIQAAYELLSNPARRAAYDEERWLRGLADRSSTATRITAEWLLNEAKRLEQHMKSIDTYRMNHAALSEYILALLSDAHLSVLQDAPELKESIFNSVIGSATHLRHEYSGPVAERLKMLTGVDLDLQRSAIEWIARRNREAKWRFYRPLVVLAFSIILAVLLYLLK